MGWRGALIRIWDVGVVCSEEQQSLLFQTPQRYSINSSVYPSKAVGLQWHYIICLPRYWIIDCKYNHLFSIYLRIYLQFTVSNREHPSRAKSHVPDGLVVIGETAQKRRQIHQQGRIRLPEDRGEERAQQLPRASMGQCRSSTARARRRTRFV